MEKYEFHSLFINQFYPRPGTVAACMVPLPPLMAKRRTNILSKVFKSYFPYNDRMGLVYDILITEFASDKVHLVGHNKFYEQVLIKADESLLGRWAKARIFEAGKFFLKGELLDNTIQSTNVESPTAAWSLYSRWRKVLVAHLIIFSISFVFYRLL